MKFYKTILSITILLFTVLITSCNIEPFEGDILDDPNLSITCDEAIQNTADAITNLSTATESNYVEKCNAYKKALQDQIVVCGDTDGTIQMVINSLDCGEDNQQNDCESITINVNNAKIAFDTANDLNYAERCVAYKTALQSKIIACGDTDGNIQSIINNLGDCSIEGVGNTDGHAFMTANINGVQFNDLKPNSYLLFHEAIGFNGFFSRSDDDYIELQGNNTYTTPTTIEVNTKEINIFIPSAYWKEGTFVLYAKDEDVTNPEIYYSYLAFDIPNNISKEDLTGEIIINKFSLVERVIQGTFEFEYKLVDETDNTEQGPFTVTGTFDYSLDDEYFD